MLRRHKKTQTAEMLRAGDQSWCRQVTVSPLQDIVGQLRSCADGGTVRGTDQPPEALCLVQLVDCGPTTARNTGALVKVADEQRLTIIGRRGGNVVIKRTNDVEVEVNEFALSLLGWEVQDFRARVTSDEHEDGECFHKLAVSGVFRFNEDDWTDCFSYSRKYPSHPVMLLSYPPLAEHPSVTEFYCQPKKGIARVSESEMFFPSLSSIDHSKLRIEITAYDSVSANNCIQNIPIFSKEIPIEIEDETTRTSVSLSFDQLMAFTYGDNDRDYHIGRGSIRASGRVLFGSPDELLADWVSTWRRGPRETTPPTVKDKAPFSRPTPKLTFEILDDSGFLLEQGHAEVDIHIPVNEAGQTPSRNPNWLVDLKFSDEDFSAPASRVIVRVID